MIEDGRTTFPSYNNLLHKLLLTCFHQGPRVQFGAGKLVPGICPPGRLRMGGVCLVPVFANVFLELPLLLPVVFVHPSTH